MLEKNKFGKTIFLTIVMAILTQPAMADISGFGPELGVPVVGKVTLDNIALTYLVVSHKKYFNDEVYSEYPSQKNVAESAPDGAAIMISSEPVIIQKQVSKNIFRAIISNDKGGYATVMLQKSGNRFIELSKESYPEIPLIIPRYN